MIDLGQYDALARAPSSKAENDRVFAAFRKRLHDYLAELEKEEEKAKATKVNG